MHPCTAASRELRQQQTFSDAMVDAVERTQHKTAEGLPHEVQRPNIPNWEAAVVRRALQLVAILIFPHKSGFKMDSLSCAG